MASAAELAPFAPPEAPTEARFEGGVDYHVVIDMPNDEAPHGRRPFDGSFSAPLFCKWVDTRIGPVF